MFFNQFEIINFEVKISCKKSPLKKMSSKKITLSSNENEF